MSKFCPCALILKLSRMPVAAYMLAFIGAFSLITAFVAEHVFNIEPCILCLWDRVPYAFVLFFALIAIWSGFKKPKLTQAAIIMTMLAFLSGVGLSVFHTGVERHWWGGTSGCTIQPLNAATATPADLRKQLLSLATRNCDEINWELFGLTLVNYNLLASIGFTFYTLLILYLLRNPTFALPSTCCCTRMSCSKDEIRS